MEYNNKFLKQIIKLSFIMCMVIISTIQVYAQGIAITGTVTDNFNDPLPGVNVVVKGTFTGQITDMNGKYTITVPNQDAVLQFSFVGYAVQEIVVGNQRIINAALTEDAQQLEEVVVVAYGVQKKVSLTGAVSTIAAEKLENRPVPNLSTSLSGLAAGVTVRQTSGDPGRETTQILIRGVGTFDGNYRGPMIIVDGAVGNLDSVNPDDVESVSILKNAAAAAIYGSRAANGVILVTTKKGQREATPKVNYSGIFSLEQPTKYHEFESDYATYMEVYNRTQLASGQAQGRYAQATIDAWRAASQNPNGIYTDSRTGNQVPNKIAFPNTDWAGVVFGNRFYQRHNLSVSGGSQNTNYMMSASYTHNPGIVEYSGLKRYQIRINLESKITDFLTVGTTTYAVREDKEPGSVDSSNSNNLSGYSVFDDVTGTVPGITPRYKGRFGGPEAAEEDMTAANVYYNLYTQGGDINFNRINTAWYANLNIFDGLTAQGYYNYQQYFSFESLWTQPVTLYRFRDNTIYKNPPALSTAIIRNRADRNREYTARFMLNYAKTLGDHDFGAMVAYEQTYSNRRRDLASRRGMMDWSITDITTAAENVSIGSTNSNGQQDDVAIISYIGRLNYAYQQKYLLEATFRRDGSSRFSPDNRWGNFPSFSAAWRISEEDFMVGLSHIISSMKLRASWGQLGNTTSGYYDWQSAYARVNTSFGGAILNGLAQDKIGNPLIQWENVTDAGVGLDVSFLRSRLGFEIDYYNRLTEGILTSPDMPITMGRVSAPTLNTSDMRNQGIEIRADWNDRVGAFRYGVTANFSYNKNKIVKYRGKLIEEWRGNTYFSNIGQAATISGNQIRTEGHRFDEFFFMDTYKGTGTYSTGGNVDPNGGPRDGMIRTPEDLQWIRDMQAAGYSFVQTNVRPNGIWYGDIIPADTNGDGIYGNPYDRQFQNKTQIPPINYGFGLNASWKGIDFSMLWAGTYGGYAYWADMGVNSSWMDSRRPISKHARTNHYYYNVDNPNDPDNNINGKYPRLRFAVDGLSPTNVVYLNNTSFLRLKNMQIGYNLPKQLVEKVYLSNLRVFFTGENLLTFTSYIGVDPEASGRIISNYPAARQLSLGINVTF